MLVDETYEMVASHVDEALKAKIIAGKYVDFAKLIPKNQVKLEADNRMEMIVTNGQQYWQLCADCEVVHINGITKCQQAFRVYSDIYMAHFPNRATELIQYDHVINSAARNYSWDNVYRYDQEFRVHMARHPDCNWGVILQ